MDGLAVARELARSEQPPAVIFVTAHEDFAVEAFDLDAIDYVLKPVGHERLERAVTRVLARRGERPENGRWLREFWVPHRSELLRIGVDQVERIDAERDYVRLHVEQGEGEGRSYLLLQTIAGLEARLDPEQFIRIHRSTILRRDGIRGLRHEGLGVWSAELADGETLRIGRTYLRKVKGMAGR
jgi:two-component system response regulator AlgR